MKKAALICVFIVIYLVCFTGYVQASLKKMEASSTIYETVQVQEGDTLWNIADRYNEQFGVSLITMLDKIYDHNQLKSSLILPGMILEIPNP